MKADLHSHSKRSDGELDPAALVALARDRGVTHLALTDHDAIHGLAEAAGAGRAEGVALVGGIEISTTFHGRELHLLGLFVLPDAPGLAAWCGGRAGERAGRMDAMIDALGRAGVRVPRELVLEEAAGATVARPHLARALVRLGYAAGIQEAFDRYLVEGTAGFRPRPLPSLEESVALVRAAGGVTSVAHPGVNRISRQELGDLARAGVDAVEAAHHDHPPTQEEAYARWAAERGLRHTGGSDFHGAVATPDLTPGARTCPPGEFDALSALARRRQAVAELVGARDAWVRAGGFVP